MQHVRLDACAWLVVGVGGLVQVLLLLLVVVVVVVPRCVGGAAEFG